MPSRWGRRAASFLLLAAHPAAAQPAPPMPPITVRVIPQEVLIDPAAPPVAQPWTATDLSLVKPDQGFAALRSRFTSQVRFRRAASALDPNRALFVPGAAKVGSHIFNLTVQRSASGRATAHLVTIAAGGSQANCDTQFEAFLAATSTALGLAMSDWQSSSAGAAGAGSPFSAQDSWSGSAGWSYNALRPAFDGTIKAERRSAPGGAHYGVVDPEMVYGMRHAVAYAPGARPEMLTIAAAEFGTAGSPAPGRCRLALVRIAPGPLPAAPTTWTPPARAVLLRTDLDRTLSLAAQYARLQPAAPGVLMPLAPLPTGLVQFDCAIGAEDGTLIGCRPSGSPDDGAIARTSTVAGQSIAAILSGLRPKAWRFDEDFFGTIPVRVEFKAETDDLPPVIDWDAVPLQAANAVSFRRPLRVTSDDYPARALRAELEATVSLDCVILPDLSPYCGRYLIEPPEAALAFAPVLRTIQRRNAARLADPLGKDGRPAAGQRYRQRIVFRVPR